MAKKIKATIKLNLPAGQATPAPPVGPALGQYGVPIMDFCRAYNEKTKGQQGIVPAVITVYSDNSFSFVIKNPPASALIKQAAGIEKGSGTTPRIKAGKITSQQLREIAEKKLEDLNTNNIEAAMKIIAGTARSMGVEIED